MARAATRPGPPSITLGVWGQGETDAENITALLDDFVDGLDGEHTVRILIPLDKDLTTSTILDVEALATERKWEVHVIQTAPPRVKALREVKEAAAKTIESSPESIEEDFVKALAEARDARLLFLWAEDADQEPDEDDQRLLFAVMDAGVVALDLTSGLDVLDSEGGDAAPEPEPEPEPEKAAPAKRTRAAAKDPEPEPEPAGDDDAEATEEQIRGWSERRLRSYAIKCGMDKDEATDLKKPALLAWIFEEDEVPDAQAQAEEPDPEPEEEKPAPRRRTTAKAAEGETRTGRQTREDIEEDGGKANSGAVRRARGSRAAEPAEEPDEAQAGAQGAVDAFVEVAPEAVREIVRELGNLLADVIIDRIAARIEAEPEKSAVREEIAPPRPPGRPRSDGGTPTRRRTAK